MVKSFFFLLVCILVVPLVDGTCVNVQPVTTIDFSNNLGGGSTNGIGSGNDWPDLVWTQTPSSAFASNLNTSCSDVTDFLRGFSGRLWLDIIFEVPCYVFEGPGDLQMSFVHQYDIESEWDGGIVKISINNNEFTLIKNSTFSENGYNEQLKTEFDGNINPLEGLDAFSGKSDGYVTSDLSLTRAYGQPFAGGDLVRLRFELGMDNCVGKNGWDIQSAEIRICETLPGQTEKDCVFRSSCYCRNVQCNNCYFSLNDCDPTLCLCAPSCQEYCNPRFCPVPSPEPSPQPSPQPSPAPLSEPSP
eukprot:scaffold135561_cov52-Attheya_sp.AAC.1